MPTNRISPGIPPSRRPGAVPKIGVSPLDAVRKISAALQEVLRQQTSSAPGNEGSAAFDLVPVWGAAKNDPGNQVEKGDHLTPKQFVGEFDHLVRSLDVSHKGKVLVDGRAALAYAAQVDVRIQIANNDHMMREQALAIQADPIQAGVDACKAGPFGLMFAGIRATAVTGMSSEAYFEAVLDRAKEQAAEMEERAGESLLSSVLKGIAGCPDLVKVARDGFNPDE